MSYKLIPFAPPSHTLSIEVTPSVLEDKGQLKLIISYRLTGELHEVLLLNDPLLTANRSHELWKNTCFEWFLKSEGTSQYWEFNASPIGHWNFYELLSYRSSLIESNSIPQPQFHKEQFIDSKTSNSMCVFTIECDLQDLVPYYSLNNANSRLAITSVIKWKSGETSYFSLKHPEDKPDFHSPEGFVLPFYRKTI